MHQSGATPVAKKKRSESRRFNTLVRMDDEVCEIARKIAALRGVSMAEMFADWLRPIVAREWSKEVRKIKDENQ